MLFSVFSKFFLRIVTRCALLVMLVGLVACQSIPLTSSSPPVQDAAPPKAQETQPIGSIKRAPKLALVLGGGAARGFAHVGVIQVLEEAGIKPDMVVGTSAGSVVASLYASGKSAEQLKTIAQTMEESALTDWKIPLVGRGMLQGDALQRYINTQVGGKRIEDMHIPLGIVATDLKSGQGVLFQRGDVATAVRASSAVPAVFEPVRIGNREFVDGGLVSPVPVRYARQMGADIVLAVDISSIPEGNTTDGIFKILLQTTAIMIKSINDLELKDADVLVRPELMGVGSANFGARQRSIEAGRLAMQQALPKLKSLLQPK
jgi:NTE family protein